MIRRIMIRKVEMLLNKIQEHSDDEKKSNDEREHHQHQHNQPGNNFSKPSSAKSSLFTNSKRHT